MNYTKSSKKKKKLTEKMQSTKQEYDLRGEIISVVITLNDAEKEQMQ